MIKTWQERLKESDHAGNEYAKGIPPHMTPPSVFYMQAEIDELRAAMEERDAEIKRLTGQLDWVGQNRSAQHDSDASEHWVVACVTQGEPGNKKGASGKFLARGKSHCECIDKFISGDIVRID